MLGSKSKKKKSFNSWKTWRSPLPLLHSHQPWLRINPAALIPPPWTRLPSPPCAERGGFSCLRVRVHAPACPRVRRAGVAPPGFHHSSVDPPHIRSKAPILRERKGRRPGGGSGRARHSLHVTMYNRGSFRCALPCRCDSGQKGRLRQQTGSAERAHGSGLPTRAGGVRGVVGQIIRESHAALAFIWVEVSLPGWGAHTL